MGLFTKRLADITAFDIFDGYMTYCAGRYVYEKIFGKGMSQEQSADISYLRQMKQNGQTPPEGWDHYRNFEKWLVDVKVMDIFIDETSNWPAWMKVKPAQPRNWKAEPWTITDEF